MAAQLCRLFAFLFFVIVFPWNIYCRSTLIHLAEDNWHEMLEGEWMVEFYAPWCPACKGLQSVWEDFSTWSSDLGIHVAQVDVTNNPGLSGRFMVTALPTIFHVKDGQFRQYSGARDKEEFMSFIEDKKWTNLEQVSKWKSPSSIQMSVVSYFFKISMTLRSVHNKLVDGYGLPYWVSLLLFGVVTVLVGAILGLMLVCVVDVVFPAKTYVPPLSSEGSPPFETPDLPSKKPTKSPSKANTEEKLGDSSPSRSLRKRKVVTEEQ